MLEPTAAGSQTEFLITRFETVCLCFFNVTEVGHCITTVCLPPAIATMGPGALLIRQILAHRDWAKFPWLGQETASTPYIPVRTAFRSFATGSGVRFGDVPMALEVWGLTAMPPLCRHASSAVWLGFPAS